MHLLPVPSVAMALKRSPLVVLAVAFSLFAFAAPATAQPITPTLTAITPESPNFSMTPRILGRAGGVGTSVVAEAFGPPRMAAIDPASTVTIYTDLACGGPVATTGSLDELEGVGIQVTVAPASTTRFYATLTEPAEPGVPSDCSSPGLVYRQVSGAPPPPAVASVNPASPADNNAPRVKGSAEDGAAVAIYSEPTCISPVLGSGSAATFATGGISVPVPDNSTTTFYAMASWAGLSSSCSSSSVTFQEVTAPAPPGEGPPAEGSGGGGVSPSTPAPTPGRPLAPRLHTVPGGRAHDTTPLVAGSAPGATRVVIYAGSGCDGAALASGSVAELGAGIPIHVGANSTTSLFGVAIDSDGERSRCSSEPVVYSEDSAPPLTRITSGPGMKTRKAKPVFRFADITDDPPGTAFVCKLDRRPWRSCQSPWRLTRVGRKPHLVRIRAIDAAGNQEAVAAKRRFKVIARAAR